MAYSYYAPSAIKISTNAGTSWATKTISTTHGGYANSVAMSDDGSVLYVGTGYDTEYFGGAEDLIYKSTNGGTSWTALSSAGRGTWFVSTNGTGQIVVALDYDPMAYTYTAKVSFNGGSTWSSFPYTGPFDMATDGRILRLDGRNLYRGDLGGGAGSSCAP